MYACIHSSAVKHMHEHFIPSHEPQNMLYMCVMPPTTAAPVTWGSTNICNADGCSPFDAYNVDHLQCGSLGLSDKVTCGVKDLHQHLVGVTGRMALHSACDVKRKLVIPATTTTPRLCLTCQPCVHQLSMQHNNNVKYRTECL